MVDKEIKEKCKTGQFILEIFYARISSIANKFLYYLQGLLCDTFRKRSC